MILQIDLGFIDLKKNYLEINIMMTKKKFKGKELTSIEKIQNKFINNTRVMVEHAIGGIK